MKTYSELILLPTFEERFRYLQLKGGIGFETFGGHRYLGQDFYQRSKEWKSTRNHIIVRDNGCDLAIPGENIIGNIIIHHINPLTIEDFFSDDEIRKYSFNVLFTNADYKNALLDEDNLISTSLSTHNKIHYGTDVLTKKVVERQSNDTSPWRH